MQTFTGSVVWPFEDYEGDHGLRHTLKVKLDQAVPARVRTTKDGLVTVWGRPGDPEIPYMQSLVKGERVNLVFDDGNSKKTSMDLVLPAGYQPTGQPAMTQPLQPQPATNQPPAAQNPPAQAGPGPTVWYPLSDADRDVKVAIATDNIRLQYELMTIAQIEAAKTDFDLPIGVIQDIAVTALIAADRAFRPGMVVYQPVILGETEQTFLAGLDDSSEEALVKSTLAGIQKITGLEQAKIGELLKSFGLTRAAILAGPESQLRLLGISQLWQEISPTKGEAEARRTIETTFGLKDASIF